MYIVWLTVHSEYWTVYNKHSVQCKVFKENISKCKEYSLQCTVNTGQCTINTENRNALLYTECMILDTIHCTLDTVILDRVHCPGTNDKSHTFQTQKWSKIMHYVFNTKLLEITHILDIKMVKNHAHFSVQGGVKNQVTVQPRKI